MTQSFEVRIKVRMDYNPHEEKYISHQEVSNDVHLALWRLGQVMNAEYELISLHIDRLEKK